MFPGGRYFAYSGGRCASGRRRRRRLTSCSPSNLVAEALVLQCPGAGRCVRRGFGANDRPDPDALAVDLQSPRSCQRNRLVLAAAWQSGRIARPGKDQEIPPRAQDDNRRN